MISGETVFRHRPDIRYRLVGGEAVVIRQKAAEVLALSAVGGRVLDLLDGRRAVDEVCARLAEEYDAEPQVIRNEVTGFLEELVEAGLIEPIAP